MANTEDVEKARQAIMCFHELLTIMRLRLGIDERAFKELYNIHRDRRRSIVRQKSDSISHQAL